MKLAQWLASFLCDKNVILFTLLLHSYVFISIFVYIAINFID